jgi:ribosome-associated protein
MLEENELVKVVSDELDLRKGENITVIDVKGRTSVTDFMIIVTAMSERHAKSLCGYVTDKLKELGIRPLGLEGGDQGSDWVLLDLDNIIVHVMTAKARELYQLEKLWSIASRSQETGMTP